MKLEKKNPSALHDPFLNAITYGRQTKTDKLTDTDKDG